MSADTDDLKDPAKGSAAAGQFTQEIQALLTGRQRLVLPVLRSTPPRSGAERAASLAVAARPGKDPALTCAAVLLPLLHKETGWHIVVTQRTETVEHHKGQISFPGGACDAADRDLLATALRETYEEIGVPPEAVQVLGALDDMITITNFVVTPFVGVIPHPLVYRLNHREVAAVVEVPLSFLCNPAHLRTEQREYAGRSHEVLFWDYGPYTIWGATARILKEFLDLITQYRAETSTPEEVWR